MVHAQGGAAEKSFQVGASASQRKVGRVLDFLEKARIRFVHGGEWLMDGPFSSPSPLNCAW
jgi:hypothetical protein